MAYTKKFDEMIKLEGKTKDAQAQETFKAWHDSLSDAERAEFEAYKKKQMKLGCGIVLAIVLALGVYGMFFYEPQQPPKPAPTKQVEQKAEQPQQEAQKPSTPEEKIKDKVKEYVKQYNGTDINNITVNPHLGTEKDGDYVVLVRLTWNVMNKGERSMKMLEMYSSDMAANMYKDLPEVQELAVFWTVPYLNNGNAKVSFERANGGMAFTDKVFDNNFRQK